MQLTENFSLAELTKSQTATRLGYDNKPNQMQVLALTKLCENVLQPVRNKFEIESFMNKSSIILSKQYKLSFVKFA